MVAVRFRLISPSGIPVGGAATLVAYPNGTRRTGLTNAQGEWRVDLYRTDQSLTFLAAAPGYLPLSTTVPPKPNPTITYRLEDSTEGREGGLFTSSPAPFQIGEALHLLDAYGVETTIRFLMVTRQFSLIEYTKPKTYEEQ